MKIHAKIIVIIVFSVLLSSLFINPYVSMGETGVTGMQLIEEEPGISPDLSNSFTEDFTSMDNEYYTSNTSGWGSGEVFNGERHAENIGFWNIEGVNLFDPYIVVRDTLYAQGTDNNGPTLITIDISDNLNPTVVGNISMYSAYGYYSDLYVQGDILYVTSLDKLFVVDISNTPTLITSETSVDGRQFVINGDYGYFADSNGLEVWNLTDYINPTMVGSLVDSKYHSSKDMELKGGYLYTGILNTGVWIANVMDPTNPISVSNITISNLNHIEISGNYLYTTSSLSQFRTYDISNHYAPVLTTYYEGSVSFYDLKISGDFAYIAAYYNGMIVMNLTNPTYPSFLYQTSMSAGDTTEGGYFGEGDISDGYAYLSRADTNYMQIIKIRDTDTRTASIHSINSPSNNNATGVAIDGNTVFSTDINGELYAVNITNAESPTLIGTQTVGNSAHEVEIDGDILSVGTDSGWQLYNVSSLSLPFPLISSVNLLGGTEKFELNYPYAYLLNIQNNLTVVDIEDITNPTPVGVYTTSTYFSDAMNLKVHGDYLYVADKVDGFHLFDITNPTVLEFKNTYGPSSIRAYDLHFVANYLYIASGSLGYVVVDISDPLSPSIAFQEYIDNKNVTSIHANYDTLYLGTFSTAGGLPITYHYNTTTPTSVTSLGLTHSGSFFDVAASGEYTMFAKTGLLSLSYSYSDVERLHVEYSEARSSNFISFTDYDLDTISMTVNQDKAIGHVLTFYISIDNGLNWVAVLPGNTYSSNIFPTNPTTTYISYKIGFLVNNLRFDYLKSTVSSVTIDYTQKLNSAPSQVAPADTGYTSDTTPTFDWDPVSSASSYDLSYTPSGGSTTVINTANLQFTPASDLVEGEYSWFVRALDSDGDAGPLSSTWTFTIDSTSPGITSPSNIEYITGDTGNVVSWTLTDLHPDTYRILLDGSENVTPTAFAYGDSINYNVDGLDIGDHDITIEVTDLAGNINQDSVLVTVNPDPNGPEISNPSDIIFVQGDLGNEISWDIADTDPDQFYIEALFSNGTNTILRGPEPWSNTTVTLDVDGFPAGTSEVILNATDLAGHYSLDSVLVSVDSGPPEIQSGPYNIYVYQFDTIPLSWEVGDQNPWKYNITIDDVLSVTNQDWTNGSIWLDFYGSELGSYIIELTVSDVAGNTASYVQNLTVVDNIVPDINSPADISFEVGSTGNQLSWTVSDANPTTYNITLNDQLYREGTWNNGTIDIDLDILTEGEYVFILYLDDQGGNYVTDEVIVTVTAASDEHTTTTGGEDDSSGAFLNANLLIVVILALPVVSKFRKID